MKSLILITITLIFSFNLSADQLFDFNQCTKIENNTKRLNCFDKTADQQLVASQTKIKTNKIIYSSQPQPQPQPRLLNKPNNSNKISKPETFGLTEKKETQSLDSQIVGIFKGWKKGDKLSLKNGQVWKVISPSAGYVRYNNPKISITRGFLGSFNAKVKGLNARAKVKRIK